MALVAVAADKGAPGVTTASLALAAVWPRPVLLAECDAAGGDLFYRLPAADGGRLNPQRGLLSLAVAARRGIQPHQVWTHTQKLHGGLDILTGLVNAEQAAGIQSLWGEVGMLLAEVPEVDVIADCGRLGADGPFYDLLAHSSAVVLIARATLEDVVRLRDRVIAVAQGLANRRMSVVPIGVVIVADRKHFKRHIAEAGQALTVNGAPARVLGGLADEPRTAHMLRGRWSTKLDRSLLIRTARELAGHIARDMPAQPAAVAGQGQHSPGWWPADRPAEHNPGPPSQLGHRSAGQAPAGQEGAGQVAGGPAGRGPDAAGRVPGERVAAGLAPAAVAAARDGHVLPRQLTGGPAAAAQVTGGQVPAVAAGRVPTGHVPTGGRSIAVPSVAGRVSAAPGQVPEGQMPVRETAGGPAAVPGATVRVPGEQVAARPAPAPEAVARQARCWRIPGARLFTKGNRDAAANAPAPAPAPALDAALPVVAAPAVPMHAVPAPATRGPGTSAPDAPVRVAPESPESPATPVLGVPVVAGPVVAGPVVAPLAAAPVPADAVPLGVPVVGAAAVTGPIPFASAPVPADAVPEHAVTGQPQQAMSGQAVSGQAAAEQVAAEQVAAEAEPLAPLPEPVVPYHAEHVAPLRLARGPESAPTTPVPAIRMPPELDPGTGVPYDGPGHGLTQNPRQGPTQNPGQSPNRDPGHGSTQNPGQSPNRDPGPSLTQNPGQSQNPGHGPTQNPGQSPDREPGQSASGRRAASRAGG